MVDGVPEFRRALLTLGGIVEPVSTFSMSASNHIMFDFVAAPIVDRIGGVRGAVGPISACSMSAFGCPMLDGVLVVLFVEALGVVGVELALHVVMVGVVAKPLEVTGAALANTP